MKRFFNFPTTLMLVFILAAIVAAVLSNPINWTGIIWMFIAGMWVANARSAQMTADSWKDLYEAQSKAFKSAKDAWAAAVNERAEIDAKYQALDNEYLKLAKEHNAQGEELAKLKKEYDSLVQSLPFEAPVRTTQPKPKKKPVINIKASKKEYTEQDQARIQEELKSAGLKPKVKKRRPAEDED